MKVLVVDSGGRGHAIAWQFRNDPHVQEVICTPGNAGIAREIRCENARTNEEILELARREQVDLVFIGPESPLTNGIVDLISCEKVSLKGARHTQNCCAVKSVSRCRNSKFLLITGKRRII